MARYVVKLAFGAILLVLTASHLRAECVGFPLKHYKESAELVFSGTIEGLEPRDSTRTIVTFGVDRVWKGNVGRRLVLYHALEGIDSVRFDVPRSAQSISCSPLDLTRGSARCSRFLDAMPLDLRQAVGELRRADDSTVYVPGHGAVARQVDLDRYIALLDEVERAARRALEQGLKASEAAARFTLPRSLGEWALFNPVFFERAFAAWYRQLEA